jgi:LemA protein
MSYNRVVRLHRNVDQAWSNVDVLLKQRHEEIPKLVDAVEEYADHEQELLQRVTETRSRATTAEGPSARADAEARLDGEVAELLAVAEDYPELRSSEQFLALQERISDIEAGIADRREFYNASVTEYNTRIQQVPWIGFATLAGYSRRELFEASDEETADVDMDGAMAEA